MLPQYLKVENFASYINETLNFETWGDVVALMGENGSGKSSIIHMITTCIFFRAPGTDAKGSGMEELIHHGADSFKIEYCFKMNNNTYIIIREKTKKGQSLKLFINGEDHSGKLSETQQKVYDIIKMDYETFMDTVIIGQGESASFMKKSATDRKKIIAQILRLDKYSVLEDYTKSLKKELKSKMLLTESKMNDLYDSIKDKDQMLISLNKYKSELNDIEQNISLKEIELERELQEKTKHEQLKKQQDSIVNRKQQISLQINNINNEIKKFEKFKVEIEDVLSKKETTLNNINLVNDNITRLNNNAHELISAKVVIETENKILSNKIDELKSKFSRLKNYNECTCQFCGQNISSQYKEKHLTDIRTEGKHNQIKLDSNLNELNEIMDKLYSNDNEMKEYKNKLNQLDTLKTKINQAEIKIETVNSKLVELNKQLQELSVEQTTLNEIEIFDIENKIFKDMYIKMELQELRRTLTFNSTQIGIIENKLEEISKNEKQYSNVKSEFNKLKEDIFINDELLKAWSKNGIQAIIIDNILPQIEEEINKYLKILSDDKISIKFETEKAAKNGNKSETLDIIVSDSNGSRSYERYSGGQKTRIDFACHIGMSKFLAKRSGSNIDFFMVDEGIGTLDEAGKQNFLDTIRLLSGIFKQVLVISHIPDIIESFNNKIIVTNDIFNGSKVNVMK